MKIALCYNDKNYCSKELLHKMMQEYSQLTPGELSEFIVSPEDLDDIREYQDNTQFAKEQVIGKIWDIPIKVDPELAGSGAIMGIGSYANTYVIGIVGRVK